MKKIESKKFGEILVEKGILKIGDIDSALLMQQDEVKQIGEILVSQGLIGYEEIAIVLETQGLKRIDSLNLEIEYDFFPRKLEAIKLIFNSALPYKLTDNTLYVVMYEPKNAEILLYLKEIFEVDKIDIAIDNKLAIDKKIMELFPSLIAKDKIESNNTETNYSNIQYFSIYDINIENKIKSTILDVLRKDIRSVALIKDNSKIGLYRLVMKE